MTRDWSVLMKRRTRLLQPEAKQGFGDRTKSSSPMNSNSMKESSTKDNVKNYKCFSLRESGSITMF